MRSFVQIDGMAGRKLMPTKSIEFTGERMVPGGALQVFFEEHFERYQFARQFVEDKVVLDAGCGEGYGPDYLAEVAKEVIGIDNSLETILNAQNRYLKANLRFKEMDATNTSFENNIFDVICAFEILEHIPNYEKLLKEMRRILKPGGLFIVSTPNKAIHSPNRTSPRSPYHFREFHLNEFDALLRGYFSEVVIYGQSAHGLFSRMYVYISGRMDLTRLGGVLLLMQRVTLSLANVFPAKSASPVALAREKKCAISRDKLERALSFVAVCRIPNKT